MMSKSAIDQSWTSLERDTDAMARALADCPADIREAVAVEPPALRRPPPELLGREYDVKFITRRVLSVTEPSDSHEEVEGTAIVAAPGAGKTSLLRTVTDNLEEGGTTVIRLMAKDITDPTSFSDSIKELSPWSTRANRERALNAMAHGATRFIDTLIDMATGRAVLKAFGVGAGFDIGAAERTLEAWQGGRTAAMKDIIRLLSQTNDKGVVLVIDEAQELLAYVDRDTERENIKRVLKSLNDPEERINAGAPNATLLVAGMRDTDQVISDFTTVPPKTHVLEPVNYDTVRQMIINGINASGAECEYCNLASDEWLEPLTTRYGGWTRHAQCAAEAAKQVLRVAGEKAVTEPWGGPLVLERADEYRDGLYDAILKKTKEYEVRAGITQLAIEAVHRNENRVPEDEMWAAMNRMTKHLEKQAGNKLKTKQLRQRVNDNLRWLTRAGLIDRDGHYYRAPIPSITKYLTKEDHGSRPKILRILQAVGLNAEAPDSPPNE